ncbi:uncharacterized protein L201_003723 [Kwoniella dendrophila CBS 6074]|uniref:Transcriptional coactivator HFI1/ADA1 n=1 Tax=Kwoniella dendrophila CBS 6074 TaxID=1295534 RepID=A0AAX4JTQ6_9TREE
MSGQPQSPSRPIHPSSNQALPPQNYNPDSIPKLPRPLPFERIDTHSIKQQLHDVLGEDGLPYWKALNGYLLGQLGRGELESMVRSWFKGDKLELHNTLLLSLLNNASIPPTLYTPITTSSINKKRKRVPYDNKEFDIDEENIEPKLRVQNLILGLSGRERLRIRRSILGKQANNNNSNNSANTSGITVAEGELNNTDNELNNNSFSNRRYSTWSNVHPNAIIPPVLPPSRNLPTSQQLSLRLSQYAKNHSLNLSSEFLSEIGEFLSVGLDTHLEDILHGVLHLTGSNRPGIGTIRIPNSNHNYNNNNLNDHHSSSSTSKFAFDPNASGIAAQQNGKNTIEGQIPKVNLNSLNHLLMLNPSLNPIISPSLYKLQSGQTISTESPPVQSSSSQHTLVNGITNTDRSKIENGLNGYDNEQSSSSSSPFKLSSSSTTNRKDITHNSSTTSTNKKSRIDIITNKLVDSTLLKLDKAGGGGDGVTELKKEKKHNLHWKYEDPAILLKDILG